MTWRLPKNQRPRGYSNSVLRHEGRCPYPLFHPVNLSEPQTSKRDKNGWKGEIPMKGKMLTTGILILVGVFILTGTALADGRLSGRERQHLHRMQKRADEHINRAKHTQRGRYQVKCGWNICCGQCHPKYHSRYPAWICSITCPCFPYHQGYVFRGRWSQPGWSIYVSNRGIR